MTRVSDRAAFAAQVAEAGGLPFLALALMEGADVQRLLEETAAAVGTRPWGVGILGFAPAHIREAQYEAIHKFRPPCALIAGGRPSQAAPLEAAGIETFMHVPSPVCSTASCAKAHASSSSRDANAVATSDRAPVSRCGMRKSKPCSATAQAFQARTSNASQ